VLLRATTCIRLGFGNVAALWTGAWKAKLERVAIHFADLATFKEDFVFSNSESQLA
jgi:hypothetical protein